MSGVIAMIRLAPWKGYRNAHPRDLIWPVSLLYAAAAASRTGWRAVIVDQHVEDLDAHGLAAAAARVRPDIVLIEFTTPSLVAAIACGRAVRALAPAAATWAVGQHATERPGDVLGPDLPFVGCLRGEYEASISELLAGGGRCHVEGSAVWNAAGDIRLRGGVRLVDDPATLPPLDPSGLALSRYRVRSMHVPGPRRHRWGFLLTSRGCPFRCTFCSQTLRVSHGRRFRAQDPGSVADDLCRLAVDHRVSAVYMIDDCWSLDRTRVLRLCEEISSRRLRVSWTVQTRADCLDQEVLAALARSGCRAIKIGVESGVDRVLGDLRKDVTRDRIRRAVREIRAAGIYLTACFMLGNPGETLSDMRESCRFALSLGADMIQVSIHTPYPGSASYALHESRLGAVRLSHYEGGPLGVGTLDPGDLEKEQRRFYLRYYLHPATLLRYVRRRAIERLADPDEWRLWAETFCFLLLHPERTDRRTWW